MFMISMFVNVCELLKYAVHSTRGKTDKNVESLFTHKSSSTFTRNVSTNMFHVPQLGLEVQRQSLKYRGTLLLNHLLRKNHLPPDYERVAVNRSNFSGPIDRGRTFRLNFKDRMECGRV